MITSYPDPGTPSTPVDPGTPSVAHSTAHSAGSMPFTGGDVAGLAFIAVVAVAAGWAMIRRSTRHATA